MTEQNRRSPDDPTLPISESESLSAHQTQDGRSAEIRVHQQSFPTKLGKYEIKEQLGAGGMGEVYRAYDSTLNRFVALKILYADHPDSIRRFLEEARLQAGIEQAFRIGQRRTVGEGRLDRRLIGLAGADDTVVGPDGDIPLPFLDHAGIGFLDQGA